MNIYDYVKKQENGYQQPVTIEEGWDWSMKEHLRRSFLYLNSQFEENNEDRTLRPNKNIVLGIMNVAYRTEGFDVKDIELFVDDPDESYKSTLSRKYHDKWALDNAIDTFIDRMVYSYCTYGGVLVRRTNEKVPEVTNLRELVFCNQRDILSNPFAFKKVMSPSKLRKMDKWGLDDNGATIDKETLISLIEKEEKDEMDIYLVYGNMPKDWVEDSDDTEDVDQMQVIAYYQDENKQERGVTLFKKEIPGGIESLFKFKDRDEIENRALGRGGVEELFEPQVWTNWNEIKVTEMLEAASKTILQTNDPRIAAKHPSGLKGVDNLEIIEYTQGTDGLRQLDTRPVNLPVFNDAVAKWEEHAQVLGSANEGSLSGDIKSGVPFKLFEAQNVESKGMHFHRRGQLATFMDEIYRDWILPQIGKEITQDTKFLSELNFEEMMEISEQVAKNHANKTLVEKVLNGQQILPGEKEQIIEETKREWSKNPKKFIEILKDDFKNITLSVRTNIAGKQKNLALLTDKVVNVLRQYIATPQIRQDPEMAKLLNVILESSGLSPIMFGPGPQQAVAPQQGGGGTEALTDLSQAQINQQQEV